MAHIPRARWYDNNVLWVSAQLVAFLTLGAIVALLLPSNTPLWPELLVELALLGAVTVGSFVLLRWLRGRDDGDPR